MLRCKKITVPTIVICIVFTFVLNMGVCNCQRLLDNFPTNFYNDTSGFSFIISPSSVRSTLGVTYLGSHGETANEMQRTMNLNGNKKDGTLQIRPEENIAQTLIYVNKTLELAPEFNRLVTDEAQASIMSVDFSNITTEQEILDLIKMKAKDLALNFFFKGFTDAITTAVVVNTLNFENEFDKPFKPFTIKNFPMMYREDYFLFGESQTLNAKALVLEFKNTETRMLVLLPNKGESINDIKRKLSNIDINSILENLNKTSLFVFLPSFTVSQTFVLNDRLKEMNIKQAFGSKANFTSVFKGKESSYIHKVAQAGSLKVNASGVSLQSATVLQLRLSSEHSGLNGLYNVPYTTGSKSSGSLEDINVNEKPPGNSANFAVLGSFIYAIFNSRTVMGIGNTMN